MLFLTQIQPIMKNADCSPHASILTLQRILNNKLQLNTQALHRYIFLIQAPWRKTHGRRFAASHCFSSNPHTHTQRAARSHRDLRTIKLPDFTTQSKKLHSQLLHPTCNFFAGPFSRQERVVSGGMCTARQTFRHNHNQQFPGHIRS